MGVYLLAVDFVGEYWIAEYERFAVEVVLDAVFDRGLAVEVVQPGDIVREPVPARLLAFEVVVQAGDMVLEAVSD